MRAPHSTARGSRRSASRADRLDAPRSAVGRLGGASMRGTPERPGPPQGRPAQVSAKALHPGGGAAAAAAPQSR